MTLKPRYEPDEVREQIVDAADKLFRRIGYTKTTIADIANALNMSSANIYRFFPNKSAINERLCHRIFSELHEYVESFLTAPGTASHRLEEMTVGIHVRNKERLTNETTVHEMVVASLHENWQAVAEHIACMRQIRAQLIQQGMESGEFAPGDSDALSRTMCLACCGIFHPTMIAENKPETTVEEVRNLARFMIRGLANHDAHEIPLAVERRIK